MSATGQGRGGGAERGGRSRGGHRGGRGWHRGRGGIAGAPAQERERSEAPQLELGVESVSIPNAFEASCAHVQRCRERGRLFHLPVTNHTTNDFVVVERTIGGIDDVVYSKHRDIWERLPRGNARVFVKTASSNNNNNNSNSAYTLVGAVNGLRKFGYSDSSYGYPDAVKTVVAVEKENGECGHISAFVLPMPGESSSSAATDSANPSAPLAVDLSRRFWIVGSKNVHVVLDYYISDASLAYYTKLGRRYCYAVKIARLFKSMLPSIDGAMTENAAALTPAQALQFHSTLHAMKWTSCFEAIFSDSQHLVDYEGANELRFYAVTTNACAFERPSSSSSSSSSGGTCTAASPGESSARDADTEGCQAQSLPSTAATAPVRYSKQDGLCLPVAEAEAFHQGVGLSFSLHSESVVFNSSDYATLLDTIGRRTNSEGCVMYGADETGRVVRLWKEKSYPYVMERATREAITNHKLAGKDLADQMRKKLRQQRAELRDYFKDWEATRMPWLLHFAAWLQVTRRLTPSMQRDELFPLRNRWLSLQREFQAAMDGDAELYDVCGHYQPDPVQWGTDAKDLDVVKFVGPQGCGKSTLSRAFYALLQNASYSPRWVNQDESGNRNKFLASLRQATHKEAGVSHLLIDKMNLDARMNHDYDQLPLSLTVTWYHPDGESALYQVCIDRVLGRGSGHRTIRIDPRLTPQERAAEEQNIRGFVRKAVHACETPQDPSEVVLELDITTPLAEMVRMMWDKLNENGTHTLPAISDEEIANAIELAHRYESLLCDLPKAPIYACIALQDGNERAKLLSVVPPDFTKRQVVQAGFHVTTKYFGGETDPVAFVALAERLGQTVELTLESVVADNDGVAVTVKRDDAKFPCANATPHFTIANRKGVPPKYSNTLISLTDYPGDPSQRRVVTLPEGVTVKGVFEFR